MTATSDRHDGESFRVSYCGFHVGYARSVPELERWIELAALEDALRNPRRWRRGSKPAVARSCSLVHFWTVTARGARMLWPLFTACPVTNQGTAGLRSCHGFRG
jgi:hypothetical protein